VTLRDRYDVPEKSKEETRTHLRSSGKQLRERVCEK